MHLNDFQVKYGMSNQDIALICGCSRSAVQHWRSGIRNMPDAISHLFGALDLLAQGNTQRLRDAVQKVNPAGVLPDRASRASVLEEFESAVTRAMDKLELALELRRERERLAAEVQERMRIQDELAQTNANLDLAIQQRTSELNRRLQMETLIATVSTRLLGADDQSIVSEIEGVLRESAAFAGVDRCAAVMLDEDGTTVRQTLDWKSDDSAPALFEHRRALDSLPWFRHELARGEAVRLRTLSDLPAEADVERQAFEHLGLRSLLVIPLRSHGVLTGMLGFGVRVSGHAWRDEDVQLLRLLGETVATVLGRQRDHAALRQSERDLRSLLDAATEAMLLIKPDGTVLATNATAAGLYGENPRRAVGRIAYGYFTEDVALARHRVIEDVLVRKQGVRYEDSLEGRVFDANIQPILGAAGEVEEIAIFARDITQQRRAEQALREGLESLRRFQHVVNRSPAVVFVWRIAEGWPVEFASENVAQFGYTADELVSGRVSWPGITHPDDVPWLEQEVKGHFERGVKEFCQQYRLIAKGGDVRWVQDRTIAIENEAGQVTHYAGVIMDITEEKRHEEERARLAERLQQAERMESLGIMAGGIAHEFNNLLTVILGHAELIMAEYPQAGTLGEAMGAIHRASGRAIDLSRQMLLCTGRYLTAMVPCDVAAVIRDMAPRLKEAVGVERRLDISIGQDQSVVLADLEQLRLVIWNLVAHAADATTDGRGCVRVRTGVGDLGRRDFADSVLDESQREGPYAFVEVGNNGAALDSDTRRRMFEPFYISRFTGRGLGLASVLGVMRRHRGTIQVRSSAEDGTTITVWFPMATPTVALPPARADHAPGAL